MSCPALAVQTQGHARLTVGAGVDTNARRDYDAVAPVKDGVGSLVGSLEGAAQTESLSLSGRYDGGLREFLRYPSEDVLVQSADTEGAWLLGGPFSLGAAGRGRDRRGGSRDYSDLSAEGFFDLVPDSQLDFRVGGGGHRFIYWPAYAYSFAASEAFAQGRYRFDKHHRLEVSGSFSSRRFNSLARPRPDDASGESIGQRLDSAFEVGARYAYKGPLLFSIGYSYFEEDSNSFGETVSRHRVAVTGAVRLPFRWALLCEGAVQLSHYPDGVFLSEQVMLEEDDESLNELSGELSRPISAALDFKLRYALYQNRLPFNRLAYLRQLAQVALSWRL